MICDIAMPEEDGYGFVSRLRGFEAQRIAGGPRVPVIALSAFSESAERSRAAGASFDFFLAKPVRPQALLATIADAMRRPQRVVR